MLEQQAITPDVLVVDLDGTLLRSDMLFESFWGALSKDWATPFVALRGLLRGRSALKHDLARLAEIEVATLPYEDEVLKYVRRWREDGGRTALVTASDASVAARISEHLGLFDEVHGSDRGINLKGSTKADFLVSRFGRGRFIYMGDASADLPVWQASGRAVTVNPSRALQTRVEKIDPEAEHLAARGGTVRPYIAAMRPHQWLKNMLVFLAMLTAHQFDMLTLTQAIGAFVAFSLIASSVYLINDLLDLKSDRLHPRKRFRPFASGTVPMSHGSAMIAGLIAGGFAISMFLGGPFLAVMAVYFVTTTAYSLWLKRRVIVDICALAGLYTIRIVAGAAATGIPLSAWLLAFSAFFFFSLAAVKRQAELIDGAKRGSLQAAGRGYRDEDLPIVTMMATASGYVSILVMALYISSSKVTELYPEPLVLGGICCVLFYWISRIIILTQRGLMHDDPVVFAAKDRISQLCALGVLAFAIGGAML